MSNRMARIQERHDEYENADKNHKPIELLTNSTHIDRGYLLTEVKGWKGRVKRLNQIIADDSVTMMKSEDTIKAVESVLGSCCTTQSVDYLYEQIQKALKGATMLNKAELETLRRKAMDARMNGPGSLEYRYFLKACNPSDIVDLIDLIEEKSDG